MNYLDWAVLVGTITCIVSYGAWKTRRAENIEGYLRGDNTSKWWMMGISVMATQASAITFISTPGQATEDGMGFIQLYFGLPVAMVIISATHNHPSGNITPSQADIDLTRKIKEAGKLLEIQVLDHLILTSKKYYSFADEALCKIVRRVCICRSNQMHPSNLQRLRQTTIPPFKKYLHPSYIPLRSIYGRVVYFLTGPRGSLSPPL